ncbi:MAG: hypothetical protein QNJ53_13730 [Pleurocapsa sp. MO_192.B19]|nr:hypothetical protein [Pleurocapsa sp. MO_192.B19]
MCGLGGCTLKALQNLSQLSRVGCASPYNISEVDLVEPAPFSEDGEVVGAQGLHPAKEEIVEAQGWIINAHGILELITYKTDVSGSPAQPQAAKICNATEQ